MIVPRGRRRRGDRRRRAVEPGARVEGEPPDGAPVIRIHHRGVCGSLNVRSKPRLGDQLKEGAGSWAERLSSRANDILRAMNEGPVLLAYDGSENAKAAIEHAGAVLQHGPAVVATAWTTFEGAAPAALLALPGDMVREGTSALDEAGRETAEGWPPRAPSWPAPPASTPSRAPCASSGPFFAALIELADELDASVIVAGSRGRSALARGGAGQRLDRPAPPHEPAGDDRARWR